METLKLLAGSLLTYAAIAACSAVDTVGHAGPVTAAAGAVSEAGATSAVGATEAPSVGGSGGLLDAAVDALVDPVPDAAAQDSEPETVCDCPPPYTPPEPEVVTVDCDQGTATAPFAVAEFPGRTVTDLSLAHAVETFTNPPTWIPDGYSARSTATFYVADGSILVGCQNRANLVVVVLP